MEYSSTLYVGMGRKKWSPAAVQTYMYKGGMIARTHYVATN